MNRVIALLGYAALSLAACGKQGAPAPESAPASSPAPAATEPAVYRVAWSHYTGWEPWGYAESSGILKKWADKYGIRIELTLVNDYIESINLYTGGRFDACTMTNMARLIITK